MIWLLGGRYQLPVTPAPKDLLAVGNFSAFSPFFKLVSGRCHRIRAFATSLGYVSVDGWAFGSRMMSARRLYASHVVFLCRVIHFSGFRASCDWRVSTFISSSC